MSHCQFLLIVIILSSDWYFPGIVIFNILFPVFLCWWYLPVCAEEFCYLLCVCIRLSCLLCFGFFLLVYLLLSSCCFLLLILGNIHSIDGDSLPHFVCLNAIFIGIFLVVKVVFHYSWFWLLMYQVVFGSQNGNIFYFLRWWTSFLVSTWWWWSLRHLSHGWDIIAFFIGGGRSCDSCFFRN